MTSQSQPEIEFDAADPVIRSLASGEPTTWLRSDLDPAAEVLQSMAASFDANVDGLEPVWIARPGWTPTSWTGPHSVSNGSLRGSLKRSQRPRR